MFGQMKIASLLLVLMTGAQIQAEDSSYTFTRGFPANPETIKKAQDATDLRRAIEAYKFFFPTVATEAVIQYLEPHGAIPIKVGVIMPQDSEQQFSVSNQDTHYVIAVPGSKRQAPWLSSYQKAILKEAAEMGYAEMRIPAFENPQPEKIVWEGLQWEW